MELLSIKRVDPVDKDGLPIVGADKVWVAAFIITEDEFQAMGLEAQAKGELDDETEEPDSSIIIS